MKLKKSPSVCILGLGRRSTDFYINALNERYQKKLGNNRGFPFVLYQLDFNEINSCLPNQFDTLIFKMDPYIKELKELPVSKYLVPNITLHETLDKMNHGLELIHPIHLAINHCKCNDIQSIVLFGSAYTMTSGYIAKHMEASGIRVIIPSDSEILDIDNLRKNLYSQTETHENVQHYKELLDSYSEFHHVLIACTELSLVSNENQNIVDMAMLQIEKTLKLSI